MGGPGGWVTELTGRAPMKSPGRPSLRREVERGLWLVVATGVTSEEAAHAVGVSQAAGACWFREGGGMPTIGLVPRSGRCPCFAEREGIALLRAQGAGGREIARQLGRSPSTTSRELRRDAATGCGKLDCRASVAQWKAELVARRPETAKLVTDERLRCHVEDRLWGRGHGADGPPAGPEGPDLRAATSPVEVTGAGCRDGAPNRSRNA